MTSRAISTFLLLSLLTHLPLTTSTPLTLPQTTTNTSLTTSNLQCINSPDWSTPSFLAGDCYTALDKFHNRKVDNYDNMVIEFYAANITPPFPSRFAAPTPQKYKYKTCTLAIVMLRDLPGGAVPGTSFPITDLASYVYIETAAKDVLKGCLSVVMGKGKGGGGGLGFVNPTGYDIVGNKNSIGVFIWDTDSIINHQIAVADTGPVGLSNLTLAQVLNGSPVEDLDDIGGSVVGTS